jgi:hypothetical protein
LKGPVLDWLLKDDPSVRYRTLTELLDVDPGDPQARETRPQIPSRYACLALKHRENDRAPESEEEF